MIFAEAFVEFLLSVGANGIRMLFFMIIVGHKTNKGKKMQLRWLMVQHRDDLC